MTTDARLHVFEIDPYWLVAVDATDALALVVEFEGGDHNDHNDPNEAVLLADDKPLTINCDANGMPGDAGNMLTRPCSEWIALCGRGLLCSTEY